MAHHYRPGMKMYQVTWERNGEQIRICALHAADEADARSQAETMLADLPGYDFDCAGTTVSVRVITFPLSPDDD
jgi:hypothetical protein